MSNPNPIIHLNSNIREIIKTGPKTEIGKFRTSLNAVRGNKTNPAMARKIPPEIRELYEFFKGKDTEEINQLFELKKLIEIFKEISFPSIIERIKKGEMLTKREIDFFNLFERTLVDAHKLEFGDKRVVEHKVSIDDIRKQMASDKSIDADFEVLKDEPIRQGMDRSGRGESDEQEREIANAGKIDEKTQSG